MAPPASRPDCPHLPGGPAPPMPRLWAVLVLTGTFMVLEAVGGWASGSLALLADAGHMLTHRGAPGLTPPPAGIPPRPAHAAQTPGYPPWEIPPAPVKRGAPV